MFGIQHYSGFVTAVLVFQAVPGPGVLAILRATAQDGIKAGMGAVLGSLCGDFLYMLAAMLGLAAVLAAYPVAFTALRWVGIAYLIWIGISLLRSESSPNASSASTSARIHFRRAFTITLTNPKAILFFMAFFPIFLRPDERSLTLGIMIVHVLGIGLVYGAGLVLIGNFVAQLLSGFKAVRTLATRLAGMMLIGFGIRLALDGQ